MTQDDLIELILSPNATTKCLQRWETQDLVLTLAEPIRPGYPNVFAVHLNGSETPHRYTVALGMPGQTPGYVTLCLSPEQFNDL